MFQRKLRVYCSKKSRNF